MRILVATRSWNSIGGNTTYSLVGEFLTERLGDYGTAVNYIEVVANFRGGEVRHPNSQKHYLQFHSEHLPPLPKARFFRKKRRIELSYETHVADATFLERYGLLEARLFSKVVHEAARELHLIDRVLTNSDDFDFVAFHRSVEATLSALPKTDDELQALHKRLEALAKARFDAMDPWEKLDIQWDDYHPAARALLDDPFLWQSINDNAPHGNDTGADLLHDFKKWNQRHPHDPAHLMARSLFESWDIDPIDYDAVDETSVRRMLSDDKFALFGSDEAMIAVAFAAVKYRGCCDTPTRDLAIKAIQRQLTLLRIIPNEWQSPSETAAALHLLAVYLSKMPQDPPDLADPNG